MRLFIPGNVLLRCVRLPRLHPQRFCPISLIWFVYCTLSHNPALCFQFLLFWRWVCEHILFMLSGWALLRAWLFRGLVFRFALFRFSAVFVSMRNILSVQVSCARADRMLDYARSIIYCHCFPAVCTVPFFVLDAMLLCRWVALAVSGEYYGISFACGLFSLFRRVGIVLYIPRIHVVFYSL